MQAELTISYVQYQAQTKLLELGYEVAQSKSWLKDNIQDKIDLGIRIRLWLKALQNVDYLEKDVIDRLVYTLADLCDANAIPYSPNITAVDPPDILVGIPGAQGEQGEKGDEGGGVPFSYESVTIDTVVDSFPISDARGVEYTLNIYDDTGQDMQIRRIQGGWSADGTVYGDDGGIGQTIRGDCSGISMSIIVTGSTVQLFATVTSGTWTVSGTRKYVPNNGNGISTPTTLTNGKLWVGNASNSPTAVTVSGDFTISNTGVGALSSGVIVNADINASAAIAVSKLAAMTASRAVVADSSGFLTTSSATATEVGHLSGVTSNIQTQLDSKLSAATGAISTVVSSNLTADRAVIANALGKIAVSSVTSAELGVLSGITATTTELNYTDGVTSNIQTQLNGKLSLTGGTLSGALVSSSTGEFQGGVRTASSGVYLKKKPVEIGDWNMDATNTLAVPHGLVDWTKIISVSAVIRNDANTKRFPVHGIDSGPVGSSFDVFFPINIAVVGGPITATNIYLMRLEGGFFDANTDFDGTGFSRGTILIEYEA